MGAGKWTPLRADNYCGVDRAWLGDELPRELPNGEMTYSQAEGEWSSGHIVWNITWGWAGANADEDSEPLKEMAVSYDQSFSIDEFGALSINKFGKVVSRGTNNVFRLNGEVVVPEPLTEEDFNAINEHN